MVIYRVCAMSPISDPPLQVDFESEFAGYAQWVPLATHPYRWTLNGNLQGMRNESH